MFEALELAPPDPILGLTEAFKRDPNPAKINLGVGVYQDESGKTPTLASVRRAEAALLEQDRPKTYLPIEGAPEYGRHVRALLLGQGHARVDDGSCVTVQSPGGTGALRLVGELLQQKLGIRRMWLSDPTWSNHEPIFSAAGLGLETYAYYDPATRALSAERMLASLRQAQRGDAVLLHTCCHNPTGVDPDPAVWQQLAELAARQGFFPLFDFAYQGFGDGLEEDAAPVRHVAERGLALAVCSSFSKNFGLYNERVGALTLMAESPSAGQRVLSQVKAIARANYSNPPAHGAAVVSTVLADPALRQLWVQEVDGMRSRISRMRSLFVATLKRNGVQQDFSFIERQKGMFSFSGLTAAQVDRLREEYAIYAVRSGRINVAGMQESSMDRLCDAIAHVLST